MCMIDIVRSAFESDIEIIMADDADTSIYKALGAPSTFCWLRRGFGGPNKIEWARIARGFPLPCCSLGLARSIGEPTQRMTAIRRGDTIAVVKERA
ncbi:hypothetical protein X739_28765 [Mesorhizobium sp. LNHC220B00]|nr:hypothetical protein X739_28765 [Mesorhizobium sp. LNHC220B00]